MRKTGIQIAILMFFLACLGQWAFGPREDWPLSYFGMYKKRIAPTHNFSFRLLGKTKSGEWQDVYSLGPYNFYAFTDAVEEIVRNRRVSNTNFETGTLNTLIDTDDSWKALEALMVSDIVPYLKKHDAHEKFDQMILRVQYWSQFEWQKRRSPDLEKILVYANYKDDQWTFSKTPL